MDCFLTKCSQLEMKKVLSTYCMNVLLEYGDTLIDNMPVSLCNGLFTNRTHSYCMKGN